MVVLYLILPLVFYSLVTGVIALHSAGCRGYVSGTLLLALSVRSGQTGRDAAHTISVSGLPSHPYPFGNWNMFICQ